MKTLTDLSMTNLLSYKAAQRYVLAETTEQRRFYERELCEAFENSELIIKELKAIVNLAVNNRIIK